jgi:peptidyl-tRNA hydrolase
MVGHVLGRFSDDEWALFQQVLDRAAQQIECWSSDGLAKAMSLYNGSVVTSTKS